MKSLKHAFYLLVSIISAFDSESFVFVISLVLISFYVVDGMTECMPISTPPLGYSLDRPGTSGVMCGPEIKIFDLEGRELKPHQTGLVVLKGMPCFNGYLNNEEANKESFFDGNWFNTGDCGYLDNDGFLFITGRMKEIINRGGETISPFEIEDAV